MTPVTFHSAERIDYKGKKAWLGLRRTGIFGSDVPAILGIDDFKRPIDVFRDKQGHKATFDGNDHTEFGKLNQSFVLNMYQKEMGYTGVQDPGLYFNRSVRYLGANPDWIQSPNHTLGAECKVRGFRKLKDYRNSECPLSDVAQACHYMAVLGVDRWDVCAIVGEPVLIVVELERDKSFEDVILTKIDKFWQNIQRDIPPKDDGSDSFVEYVRARNFKFTKKVRREADMTENFLIDDILERRKQIEELQIELNKQENILKQRIGTAHGLNGSNGKCTWSRFEKKNTKWKDVCLEAKVAEKLVEGHSTVSESERFMIERYEEEKGEGVEGEIDG